MEELRQNMAIGINKLTFEEEKGIYRYILDIIEEDEIDFDNPYPDINNLNIGNTTKVNKEKTVGNALYFIKYRFVGFQQ